MTTYAVIWTEKAYHSLKKIHEFLTESSSKGAKKVVAELVKCSKKLERLPRSHPIEPVLENASVEYRFLTRWHYKIIYTILEEEKMVLVVLVFDSRQDPAKLKI